MEAYASGNLQMCPVELDNYDFTGVEPKVPFRINSDRAEAKMEMKEGNRGTVETSRDGSHMISHMGWDLHVGMDETHGFPTHDIRFKGERILVYAISGQEYFTSYSGYGSTHQVFYKDTTYGMGTKGSPLLPGVD